MKKEVKPLTGIRGIAACIVVLFHLGNNPQFRSLSLPAVSHGYLGVDLFFVLSGFVMALVYNGTFRTFRTEGTMQGTTEGMWPAYGHFLLQRFARIYPLYIVITLIFTLRFALNISDISKPVTLWDFLINLVMVQGWGVGAVAIAGASWSVSTEVLAYLMFPLLILLTFSRLWGLQLALSVSALVTVMTSGLGQKGALDVVSATSVMPLLRCLAGFSLGLLAYRFGQTGLAARYLSGSTALLGTLAALILLLAVPNGDVAVVLCYPVLIIATWFNNRASAVLFGNRLVHHLGVISYSIYLWHPLFRDIAGRALVMAEHHGIVGYDVAFSLGGVAVTWAVSYASYRLIEVPGRRLVHRLAAIAAAIRSRSPAEANAQGHPSGHPSGQLGRARPAEAGSQAHCPPPDGMA